MGGGREDRRAMMAKREKVDARQRHEEKEY